MFNAKQAKIMSVSRTQVKSKLDKILIDITEAAAEGETYLDRKDIVLYDREKLSELGYTIEDDVHVSRTGTATRISW